MGRASIAKNLPGDRTGTGGYADSHPLSESPLTQPVANPENEMNHTIWVAGKILDFPVNPAGARRFFLDFPVNPVPQVIFSAAGMAFATDPEINTDIFSNCAPARCCGGMCSAGKSR